MSILIGLCLLAIPLMVLAVFFLKRWKRIVSVAVIMVLPLLFYAILALMAAFQSGFSLDNQAQRSLGMGLEIFIGFNIVWLGPALIGAVCGGLALLFRR